MKKIVVLFIVLGLVNCTKEETQEDPTGQVAVTLNHVSNQIPAEFDTLKYQIPSGYDMSLTRWEYYISGIEFYSNDSKVHSSNEGHYINGRYEDTWTINMSNVPHAQITKVKFVIGLTADINITGGLPNTAENIGMAWPDVMGGGYHFMKLEGHFKKGGLPAGYAMHLGENGYQVELSYDVNLNVNNEPKSITMDIDAMEWFTNPYDFDFETDGNYTMGIPALMQKLTDNGATVINNVTVQ